ncbi:4-alpha-glucanotransferase, partial [Gemmatimonas sp.]|uniref:4-alpha-glucanotransferase n=1 Tax=Gemmatimonas sp. TaxID=1962908 RepID=UPI00391C0C20
MSFGFLGIQFGWGLQMANMQYAIDGQDSKYIPHRNVRDQDVYTGTHDTHTTMGCWHSTGEGDSTRSADAVAREKAFARRYLDTDGTDMHW